MSEVIKCPICHEMAGIRYNENRVYQCRCQNMKCRETVTLTAPSEVAAEELFSKFEKGTIQPRLTIPKSIADGLDEEIDDGYKNLIDVFQRGWFISEDVEDWYYGKERELVIVDTQKSILIVAYLLGKALGVDLVKVVEG